MPSLSARLPPSLLLAALAGLAAAGEAMPPAAQRTIDFVRDVQPLLRSHCWSCHGPEKQKADLRLDRKADALRGGERVVILPGKGAESPLVRLVAGVEPDALMPPAKSGKRLPPEQVGVLRAWIDQGAPWPDGVDPAATGPDPAKHWAFLPPRRGEPPATKDAAWPRNPIDRFVLARLERDGLAPSPPAEPAAALRRLSLEITGIPPTPAEVDAFLADRGADAWERQVDRLLASPRYGERWARPWLDAARYGDTDGYEKDPARSIWPWRDWVIRALNADLPFDRFTIEQLAGDLLPDATDEQRIATGFHRNTLLNDEGGVEAEEFRVAAVVDRVNTTGTVWLGLTLACAQCHNHKYDPLSIRDYYALYAIFNSTEDGGVKPAPTLAVAGSAEQRAQREHLRAQIAAAEAAKDKAKADALRKEEKALAGKLVTTLIMRELPQPRPTRVLLRGSHLTPGDAVEPGLPAALPKPPPGGKPDRLGLARWLVSPENPLTARVTVNRLWGEIFGTGLVDTPEDFGLRGSPPSHPELLDWLATEFIRLGWSQKALLRLIVTSATWRQSAGAGAAAYARDPHNRLLARGPRLRADAEMVRDIALAASGRLVEQLGGPPVKPPQPPWVSENSFGFQSFAGNQRWVDDDGPGRYRRALYTYWRRTTPYPTLQVFDAGTRDVCKVRRSRTNTPLQVLVTLNDPLWIECAGALALRMRATPGDAAARAAAGLRWCVARAGQPAEIARLVALHAQALAAYQTDAAGAAALLKAARVAAAAGDAADLAAWTLVANALLSLEETSCK